MESSEGSLREESAMKIHTGRARQQAERGGCQQTHRNHFVWTEGKYNWRGKDERSFGNSGKGERMVQTPKRGTGRDEPKQEWLKMSLT